MTEQHESFQSGLESYLDGGLPPERARAFEEHLAACESCRVAAELSREVREALRSSEAAPEPSIWPEVRARIERERDPRFRAAMGLAVAASLLLGVLAGSATIHRAPLARSQSETAELWSSLGSTLGESESLETYFGDDTSLEEPSR